MLVDDGSKMTVRCEPIIAEVEVLKYFEVSAPGAFNRSKTQPGVETAVLCCDCELPFKTYPLFII